MRLFDLRRYANVPGPPPATLGGLYEGRELLCFTLEDMERPEKIAGETAIPAGLYPLAARITSPMEQRYRAKYAWHSRGMVWVTGIQGFEFVYFHPGNDPGDTEGCILTGNQLSRGGRVLESVPAYERVYHRLHDAIEHGGALLRVSHPLAV